MCWLPGGESLVFSYLETPKPGIFTVDMRSKRVSALPGAEKLMYPKCSTRGDVLAWEPIASAGSRLWIRWHGRDDWERVAVDHDLAYPNWTRDGEAIVGLNWVAGRVERFGLKTRALTTIADLSSVPLVTLVSVPWMGLDDHDSPLVLRDHSVRDLYALELSTDRR